MNDLTSPQGTARVIEIMARVAMGQQASLLLDIGYKRDQIIAIIDQAIQMRNPLHAVGRGGAGVNTNEPPGGGGGAG